MSATELFNSLAADYEAHFAVTHRRAYDILAWEVVSEHLPRHPCVTVDVGCGIGRWARRLVGLGHRVIGIEQAPAMAAGARRAGLGAAFELIEAPMEEVALPAGEHDVVLALGSLQYALDPGRMIVRFAEWLRPGGFAVVLVDSVVGIALEKLGNGDWEGACSALRSRRGAWTQNGNTAPIHLLDVAWLTQAFEAAGLAVDSAYGLLARAPVIGVPRLNARLERDWAGELRVERRLMNEPGLADLGKQLLLVGHRV